MQRYLILFSLTLFFARDLSAQGYTLKSCVQEKSLLTSVYVDRPECMPDTLYHWLPKKYLDWKIVNSTADDFFPIPLKKEQILPVFTWRTPVGAHGYGDVSIRVKLKSDIVFAHIPTKKRFKCGELSEKYDLGRTVFVSYQQWSFMRRGGFLSEYIICDNQVVRSWSYGTATHLQEMRDEIDWVDIYDNSEWDSLISGVPVWDISIDGKNFSKKAMMEKMKAHEDMAPGGVIVNPSMNLDAKAEETEHFATDKPIFFNKF